MLLAKGFSRQRRQAINFQEVAFSLRQLRVVLFRRNRFGRMAGNAVDKIDCEREKENNVSL